MSTLSPRQATIERLKRALEEVTAAGPSHPDYMSVRTIAGLAGLCQIIRLPFQAPKKEES